MISKFVQKILGLTLLSIFAFSCVGLGVGMLGHSAIAGFQESVFEKEAHQHHTCCTNNVFSSTDQFPSEDQSLHKHELLKYLTFPKFTFTVLLAIAVMYVAFHARRLVIEESDPPVALYERLWRDVWRYFAYSYQMLFSQGILHSKAW